MLNLNIDIEDIQGSFERISKDLIRNYQLVVNNKHFAFTEIEFYYFHTEKHRDFSVHKHMLPEGNWRAHNQGLDITFAGTDKTDGGILIRGIREIGSENYTNGPRKVIFKIFESFPLIHKRGEIRLESKTPPSTNDIKRTFRHGISKTTENEFREAKYRYFTDWDSWEYYSSGVKEEFMAASDCVF